MPVASCRCNVLVWAVLDVVSLTFYDNFCFFFCDKFRWVLSDNFHYFLSDNFRHSDREQLWCQRHFRPRPHSEATVLPNRFPLGNARGFTARYRGSPIRSRLTVSWAGAKLPLTAEWGETGGLANRHAARPRGDVAGLRPAGSQIPAESDDGEAAHTRLRRGCAVLLRSKMSLAGGLLGSRRSGCGAVCRYYFRKKLFLENEPRLQDAHLRQPLGQVRLGHEVQTL